MRKPYCIEPSLSLCLMPRENSCYNNVPSTNTILPVCGPTPVVVTNATEKRTLLQVLVVCRKKWVFVVPLKELFSFIYKAPFDNGLTEHELDHVMVGYSEASPSVNKEEVAAWKWMSMDDIATEIKEQPEHFTEWFKIIFDRVNTYLKNSNETS